MRCYIARKLSGVIGRYRGFLPIGQGNWVLSHTRHPHAFNPVSHQDHLFLWVSGGWVSSFQNQRYQMRSQHVYVSLVAQSCPTPCSAMDCSLPGSSVHGILQARILEWVTILFSRAIFPTQESNLGLLYCRQIQYQLSHQGSLTLAYRTDQKPA